MATQPRQKRSIERRETLLDAALTIMLEHGPSAVTHRAVAAAAGVPAASTTYYFDSIADLIGEALQRETERRTTELRESMVDSLVGAVDRGEVVDRLAMALATRDRRRVALRYELYGAAVRNPGLMSAVAHTGEELMQSTRRSLAILGIDPANAGEFLAMMEGFAVLSLTAPISLEAEIARIMRALTALISVDLPVGTTYEAWSRAPIETGAP